ncbi:MULTISPECIES: hypothetical protein [unclassified Sphingomonas]|uniref:hypothetical protein n=1 Tax=unclassified Sphingomonas TaxID=196159 RepID=UPI00226AB16D|nr:MULTISPECIES: hypothetical protein [unclassified Sphingomonas]
MTGGRPLRFLFMLLGGWTAARVVLLWPVPGPVADLGKIAGLPAAAATLPYRIDGAAAEGPPAPFKRELVDVAAPLPTPQPPMIAPPRLAAADPLAVASPLEQTPRTIIVPTPLLQPLQVAAGQDVRDDRWAASAWLIARGGSQQTLLGGQLGASQGGVRVTYLLDRARRIAAAARVATPLRGRGAETGIGVDWQPTRAPIHLVAEQRLSLDGGRGGPTVEVIGGFGPTELGAGIRGEGYGQAGAIARDGVQAFADGAVRLFHPLTPGRVRIDLGIGAWGGAQPGVARLDVGPSLAVSVPVAGKAIRLTLDWRERVAGAASPGSGPALSIGSDF